MDRADGEIGGYQDETYNDGTIEGVLAVIYTRRAFLELAYAMISPFEREVREVRVVEK